MKDFFDPLGLALQAAILVPNLIFALTHRQGFENAVSCPRLERWEQVGRFGFILLLFEIGLEIDLPPVKSLLTPARLARRDLPLPILPTGADYGVTIRGGLGKPL